jgi:carboxymethylenebutenolidase
MNIRAEAPVTRARPGRLSVLPLSTLLLAVVLPVISPASRPSHQPATAASSLPASEAQAKATLERSPRHGEYVEVKLAGAERPLRAWIVYPERKDKAPVVIVIHEIFGLSDWIRAVADQLAKDGFIAIAPDLISGKGPGGGGTDSLPSRDDVVKLVTSLAPADVQSRLDATRAYAIHLPAASDRTATVGFCWGGTASFAYATTQPALNAAVVYYGTPPPATAMANIKAAVLGLYGGDDARVTSTVDATKAEMARLGKAYESEIFPGAGHGFLRAQDDRSGANLKAAEQAWPHTIALLRRSLG